MAKFMRASLSDAAKNLHDFQKREKSEAARLALVVVVIVLCIPGFTVIIDMSIDVIDLHQTFLKEHAVTALLGSIAAAACAFIISRKFDSYIEKILQVTIEQQHTELLLKNTIDELQHSERIAIALVGPEDTPQIMKIVANALVSSQGLNAALVAHYSHEKMTVTHAEVSFASETNHPIQDSHGNPQGRNWAAVLRDSEIARRVLRAETVISADLEDPLASNLLDGNEESCKTFMYSPILIGDQVAGFVAAGTPGESFSTEQQASIARTVHLAAVAMDKAELFASVCEQERDLRSLSASLGEVEETERKLLAGELHDQIGPNLTALGINLNIIRNGLSGENAKELEPRIADSLKLLSELADRTRTIITNLHPPGLSDHGLPAALRDLSDRFSYRSGIIVELHLEEQELRPMPESERILFRIVLEGLNNIARHSGATRAEIRLGYEAGSLKLFIGDNGKGFSAPDKLLSPGQSKWGLRNMRERAEFMGGRFRIDSSPGKGTQILVEVPVK